MNVLKLMLVYVLVLVATKILMAGSVAIIMSVRYFLLRRELGESNFEECNFEIYTAIIYGSFRTFFTTSFRRILVWLAYSAPSFFSIIYKKPSREAALMAILLSTAAYYIGMKTKN